MTQPQSVRRLRRASAVSGVPDFVLAYFRTGEACSLIGAFPFYALLPDWWRAYKAEHPDAQLPPDCDPEDFADVPPALSEHQKMVMRSAKTSFKRWLRLTQGKK